MLDMPPTLSAELVSGKNTRWRENNFRLHSEQGGVGVKGLSEPGSFKRSTVNERLLMMASTLHMNILSDLFSSHRPLF